MSVTSPCMLGPSSLLEVYHFELIEYTEWLLHLYICFYLNAAFKTFKMQHVQFLCQYMIPKPINQSINQSISQKSKYQSAYHDCSRQHNLRHLPNLRKKSGMLFHENRLLGQCWQTIFMKYHSLFLKKAALFESIVCCKLYRWRFMG